MLPVETRSLIRGVLTPPSFQGKGSFATLNVVFPLGCVMVKTAMIIAKSSTGLRDYGQV